MQPAVIITAIVLALAPNFAATPDGPEQAMWSLGFEALLLLALVTSLALQAKSSDPDPNQRKLKLLLIGFPAWICLSLIVRIIAHRGSLAYLDVMLRGVTYFVSCAAVFVIGRRAAAAGGTQRLILIGAILAGAFVVSGIGINEYLTHLRAGEATWRVFSRSTPDFLAGYLVMVVPVTLALLLTGPRSIATYAGFGSCLVLEVGTILTTASRFALVSVAVSLVVFAVLSVYSKSKEGGTPDKKQFVLFGGSLAVLLGLCLTVSPIRKRLLHPDQNSAAFRVWTWKGTLHMIEKHPFFGSGIDTYVYTYPAYALTGFTRLAHEAYLQVAAETGIPGLLILIGLLAFTIVVALKNLQDLATSRSTRDSAQDDVWNPRIIYCGVIACAVAGLVQNFIDSDLYVFSCASALFAMLGLCAGKWQTGVEAPGPAEAGSRRRKAASHVNQQKAPWTPARIGVATAASLLCLLAGFDTLGEWYALRAYAALGNRDLGTEAATDYQAAMQVSPWNGKYPSDFGYQVTYRMGNNPANAENDLRNAVSLLPDEVSYRRLSEILAAEGKTDEAIEALDAGLRQSPNDLDLLLRRARISPPQDALRWYQRIADLETTPVGTVRALDAIELDFPIADVCIADADFQAQDTLDAIRYYTRAKSTLSAYFSRGGGHDAQQMILTGGYDQDRDKAMQALRDHCTSQLQALQANP